MKLFIQEINRIAESRKFSIRRKTILDQPPMSINLTAIKAVEQDIEQGGQLVVRLVSMVSRGATHMAKVTRSGMIFTQSVNSKSRCADKATMMNDIEYTASTILFALLILDEELD